MSIQPVNSNETIQICIYMIRGALEKFRYEVLYIRKKKVCFTDFMYRYSLFHYTSTCELSKGMEQTINIIIRIRSSLSHIYICLYLKMRIKKGGVRFHIFRVAVKSFLYITILSISQHSCNFKVRLKVWK